MYPSPVIHFECDAFAHPRRARLLHIVPLPEIVLGWTLLPQIQLLGRRILPLLYSCCLFSEKHFLRLAHLLIDVYGCHKSNHESEKKYDGVDSIVCGFLDKEDANIDENYLFRKCEEGGDCEMPEFHVASAEDGSREVGWDHRESNDEHDLGCVSS